jgi:hypothetical protein
MTPLESPHSRDPPCYFCPLDGTSAGAIPSLPPPGDSSTIVAVNTKPCCARCPYDPRHLHCQPDRDRGHGRLCRHQVGPARPHQVPDQGGAPHNIRVTAFSPGGTDTPFRAEARPHTLAPDTVAEAILLIAFLPENGVVHDLVLRPIVETNFQDAMGPVPGHPRSPRRNWRARRALPGCLRRRAPTSSSREESP